jgi:hypothetical protein
VIDQRTSHNQMDYLVENIRNCIKNAKTKKL